MTSPFYGSPQGNPYAPPTHQISSHNPLLVPAIFLLVLSALFLGLLLLSLPGQVLRLSKIDASTPEGMGELMGAVVALVAWVGWMLAIIAGSTCMLRMKGIAGAWIAAIAAVVPVCSPCVVLGIPFGIWAIVLLCQPEVRARFR